MKQYMYIVVDTDGDHDATLTRKGDAVAYADDYVGFKVYRYQLHPNAKRKDGAVHERVRGKHSS